MHMTLFYGIMVTHTLIKNNNKILFLKYFCILMNNNIVNLFINDLQEYSPKDIKILCNYFNITFKNKNDAISAIAKKQIKNHVKANLNGSKEDEFINAIKNHDNDKINQLIDTINVNYENEYGITPLMVAVSNNYPEIVKKLLERGADPNILNNYDFTALSYIYLKPNLEIVKMLIKNGADPNVYAKYNYNNEPNYDTLIIALFDKIYYEKSKNNPNGNDIDILYNIIAELLKSPIPINNQESVWARIVNSGKIEIMQEFLKVANDKKYYIDMGLFFAKDIDTVQFLLKNGANPNATFDDKLLIFSLLENQNLDIFKILIDAGMKINVVNSYDQTPLIRTLYNLTLAKLLLENGADPNFKMSDGKSAIFYIDNYEQAKLLLENGAKINVIDNEGNTPLINFIKNVYNFSDFENSNKVIKFLIDHGIDINAKNKSGDTAILLAAENGAYDIVELLYEYGADPLVKNKKGEGLRGFTDIINKEFEKRGFKTTQDYLGALDKTANPRKLTMWAQQLCSNFSSYNYSVIKGMAKALGIKNYNEKDKQELCAEIAARTTVYQYTMKPENLKTPLLRFLQKEAENWGIKNFENMSMNELLENIQIKQDEYQKKKESKITINLYPHKNIDTSIPKDKDEDDEEVDEEDDISA